MTVVALVMLLQAAAPVMLLQAAAPGAAPPAAPSSVMPAAAPQAGMNPAKPIGINIYADPRLATLVTLVRASDIAPRLQAPGPMTLFAPTREAFARLAPGSIEALTKPENRKPLGRLLTGWLVPGALSVADLRARIAAGGGTATLKSVAGDTLTLTLTAGVVTLADAAGNRSYIETADLRQSNGVVHVVNGVLVPRM